jgi:hypothetical protein
MTDPLLRRDGTFRTALVVLLLAVLFDRLFWGQGLGLNLALFAPTVMLCSVFAFRRKVSIPARATLAGLAVCCAMVLVHGSVVAKVGTLMLLVVSAVLLLEPALRSLPFALLGGFVNLVHTPIGVAGVLGDGLKQMPATRSSWRWTRLAFLPVLVVLLYLVIYRAANPRFDALAAGFFGDFFDLLWDFISELFTPHMFFVGFAVIVCGALVHRFAPALFAGPAWPMNERLQRVRRKRQQWLSPLAMGALDRERRAGVLLLVMVNVLLLIVNLVDISWVWFGFKVEEGFSLKQFVHEGTWLLILSILLSIAILLHLFRGNLNFHPKERLLRLLATIWIVQNFILGISVFLRNYHYIHFHGLAYKRIGVVVFLMLVLVGLVTLYLKIRERRTLYYLLRVNAWAAFVALVGLSMVNWDGLIVRFNLAHWNQGEIDVDNYLSMSDKVLPLLYADLPKVEAQMAHHRENRVRWVEHLDPATFRADLDRKRERFLRRYTTQDRRSWTLADQRTYEALKAQNLASWSEPVATTTSSMQSAVDAVVEEAGPDDPVVGPGVEAGTTDVEAQVVEEPNAR